MTKKELLEVSLALNAIAMLSGDSLKDIQKHLNVIVDIISKEEPTDGDDH